jgi:hypothetical protein
MQTNEERKPPMRVFSLVAPNHPPNTIKTIIRTKRGIPELEIIRPENIFPTEKQKKNESDEASGRVDMCINNIIKETWIIIITRHLRKKGRVSNSGVPIIVCFLSCKIKEKYVKKSRVYY